MTIEITLTPHAVRCPTCKAEPGADCVTPSGKTAEKHHVDRQRAFDKQQADVDDAAELLAGVDAAVEAGQMQVFDPAKGDDQFEATAADIEQPSLDEQLTIKAEPVEATTPADDGKTQHVEIVEPERPATKRAEAKAQRKAEAKAQRKAERAERARGFVPAVRAHAEKFQPANGWDLFLTLTDDEIAEVIEGPQTQRGAVAAGRKHARTMAAKHRETVAASTALAEALAPVTCEKCSQQVPTGWLGTGPKCSKGGKHKAAS